jgi:hypothetical protein
LGPRMSRISSPALASAPQAKETAVGNAAPEQPRNVRRMQALALIREDGPAI